jgi:putative aldouronate transport system permease protein
MYLNLGTIPNYLNIKSFGMIDTVWALIIPGALSVYNMIIMRTAFASIDDSLYEAARIDGCGEFKIMYRIAIPLCVPTIATLCLFYAVGRWNGIDDQLYYVQKTGLHTVQMALKQMIEAVNVQSEESGTTQLVAENIKAASITLSMTPMLVVYPFIQRFFTQGIMLGAVKG